MRMVADVMLSWTRSVSSDITRRKLTVSTSRASEQETLIYDLGPEVSEYQIVVRDITTCTFKTEVFDDENRSTESSLATFSTGDLLPPQPDTELKATVLGVRDLDAEPTA